MFANRCQVLHRRHSATSPAARLDEVSNTDTLKVFLATAPCDLRMNFNGLWAAAQERLGEDPKGGALFVFGTRRHNRIKILYFDGTGVCVLAKRLEEGTFHWPRSAGDPGAKLRLAPQALQLLLDGVDLKDGARRAWYESAA